MAEGQGDRLVVGYKEAIRKMCSEMAGVNDHNCDEATPMGLPAMAKALWNAGYRFDPEARKQWLIVELRSSLDGSLSEMFAELMMLMERDG
jgi:hypothetical protein